MPRARHWPWIALVAAAALATIAVADAGNAVAPPERVSEPRPLLRHGAPTGVQAAARPTSSTTASWVRTAGALAAVVALILLLAWGYRRAAGLPAGLGRGRNLGLVEVVSRASLTPRQSLWLVRVGPRLVLVGGGTDGLRSLDVIADPNVVSSLLGEAAARRADSNVAAFSSTLADQAREYAAQDEAFTPLDPPKLDAVRAKLAQTMERLKGAAPVRETG